MSPVLSNDSMPVNSIIQSPGNQSTPIFKILKRPNNIQCDIVKTERPKVPTKSLEQREREYAQARLRILGPDSNGRTSKKKFPFRSSNQCRQNNTIWSPHNKKTKRISNEA